MASKPSPNKPWWPFNRWTSETTIAVTTALLASAFCFSTVAVGQGGLPKCPEDTTATWNNCQGTYTSPSGDRYVGEWRNGKRDGQGTYMFSSGEKYVGEWRDGKRAGEGTSTYPDGRHYVGEWRDGEFNGNGILTSPNGAKYTGEFRDGNFNGNGTFTFPSGAKYVGEFRDGKIEGQGVEYLADGSIGRSGIWSNDEYVRPAEMPNRGSDQNKSPGPLPHERPAVRNTTSLDSGHPRHGLLGVRIEQVTPELADSVGLNDTAGAMVAGVVEYGPAEKAKIRRGDIILKFDGKDVKDVHSLPRIVAETAAGKQVEVVLWRDGKEVTVVAVLDEKPPEKLSVKAPAEPRQEPTQNKSVGLAPPVQGGPPAIGRPGWLGVRTQQVPPELVERLRRKDVSGATARLGAAVVGVVKGSPAEKAGIRNGDIILTLGGYDVRDPVDLPSIVAVTYVGKQANVLLLRDGREVTVMVTMAERPPELVTSGKRFHEPPLCVPSLMRPCPPQGKHTFLSPDSSMQPWLSFVPHGTPVCPSISALGTLPDLYNEDAKRRMLPAQYKAIHGDTEPFKAEDIGCAVVPPGTPIVADLSSAASPFPSFPHVSATLPDGREVEGIAQMFMLLDPGSNLGLNDPD